jgi:hypothetical protein
VQIPSILVAKLLRITVFVRDRVTGDTLPVTVTSSQPAPLELQPGTAAFDQGNSLSVCSKSERAVPNILRRTINCDSHECAGGRQRVLCCGDIRRFNSRAIVMVLLAVADVAHRALHLTHFRCCLPIFEKNTLQLGTSKGSRPPTSQSVKEITKAGNMCLVFF